MATISYRRPQQWNLIPDNIKSEPALELLRKKTRKWNVNPEHVEYVKPDYNIQALQFLKKVLQFCQWFVPIYFILF